MRSTLLLAVIVSVVSADFFDFFNQQQQHQQQAPQFNLEEQVLESSCNKYICPDTLVCASSPQECPCPFPSSQLRCVLPNKEYICISKPAGKFDGKYDNSENNWKVDAGDNNVRDCGWVKRAWEGLV